MKASKTKQAFGDALLALCEDKPLSQINASMVIAESARNRNTFYYHFEDKTALALWIFLNDLGQRLECGKEGIQLDFDTSEKPLCERAFYAREVVGIRSIDSTFFMKSVIGTLIARKPFFKQVFAGETGAEVKRRIAPLYEKSLAQDLEIILGGRMIAPADRRFLISYHTNGLCDAIAHAAAQPNRDLLESRMSHFLNLIPDSMSHEVENRRF